MNKHLLQGKILNSQDQALKCMEFSTVYQLKKAQYRILNPFHKDNQSFNQINNRSQLMAYMSNISQQKKSIPQKFQSKKFEIKQKIGQVVQADKIQAKPSNQEQQKKQWQAQSNISLQNKKKTEITSKTQIKKQTQNVFVSPIKPLKPLSEKKQQSKSLSKNARNSKHNNFPKHTTLKFNQNKFLMQGQIQLKQEQLLKNMQFSTQFLLKQSQYRLLNPFHQQKSDFNRINSYCELMNELTKFSFGKIPQSPKNKNKKLSKLLINKDIDQNIIKKQQLLPKQLKFENNLKYEQQLEQFNFKPIQTSFEEEKSQNSSKKSKRNKEKVEKISNLTKQKKPQVQRFPDKLQTFNFKKKNHNLAYPVYPVEAFIQQHSIIKKTSQLQDQSQDSFDNYQLAEEQDKQQEIQQENSLHSSDFQSYNSSTDENKKKYVIGVVSQHASQNQISQISVVKPLKNKKRSQRAEELSNQINKELRPIKILSEIMKKQSLQQSPEGTIQLSPERTIQLPSEKNYIDEELRKNLILLQSFDVQQQILIKRISKIWNKDFDCIKKLKGMKWSDLNLPRPNYKITFQEYADVIQ